MTHDLNNLPEEYDAIFDGLENHQTLTSPDALTMEVIHDKLNDWYEKNKYESKGKMSKEKALAAHGNNLKVGATSVIKLGLSQLTQNVQGTKMKQLQTRLPMERRKVTKSFQGNVLIVEKQGM